MDVKRITSVIGGAVAFVAAVAAGSFTIVSLTPQEQAPIELPRSGLLMEDANRLLPSVLGTPRLPSDQTQAALRQPEAPRRTEALYDFQPVIAEPSPPPMPEHEAVPPDVRAKKAAKAPVKAESAPVPKPGPSSELKLPLPRPPSPAVVATLPSTQPPSDGRLTPGEIRRMRLSLRLTREQEPFWVPVEQALMELSTEQAAMARAGQDPRDVFGIGAGMRLHSVARPLLDQLREDQKAQVRARVRAMGFGSIASSI